MIQLRRKKLYSIVDFSLSLLVIDFLTFLNFFLLKFKFLLFNKTFYIGSKKIKSKI